MATSSRRLPGYGRAWSWRRVASWWPFGAYLLAQAYCVAGLPTLRYPDSAQYLPLSFLGNAPNLFVVPLLYTIFPSDPLRIAGQVLLAALCWWALAAVVAGLMADRRVALAARITVLLLGLVSPIVSWNSTILSESSSISLTALLVAAWITYVRTPTWRSALGALSVTLLWTFTRQAQVVLSLFVVAFALVALVRRPGALRCAVLVGAVLISAAGFAEVGRGHYVSNGNVADIIEDRILPNPGFTAWFVQHGMPYDSAVAQSVGGQFGTALLALPYFDTWLTAHGSKVYVEFMLTHPSYTLYATLPSFSGELATLHEQNTSPYPYTQPNPTPSMLSPDANYGRFRAIEPVVLEELLFQQGQIGDVVALGVVALVLGVVARRRFGRDSRLVVPLLLLATVVPHGYLVWLGGGPGEVDRNSMVLAVSVRLALWIVLFCSVDRLIGQRQPRWDALHAPASAAEASG